MKKNTCITLMMVGIVIIIYSVNASNSFGSDVSHFFSGSPTDKTAWLQVGGLVAVLVGLSSLFRGSKV